MQIFKIFGILLLLISGGNSFAVNTFEDLFIFPEIEDVTEVSRDTNELSESRLCSEIFSGTGRNFTPTGYTTINQLSAFATGQAKRYLSFSRLITPSLGPIDLIYPFHAFF